MKKIILTACVLSVAASAAYASPMVYRGMNPHISPSAYPSSEAAVTNIANINKPKNTGPVASNRLSTSEQLKSATIASLSSSLSAQLLASSPTANGTVQFGDGNYAVYSTTGGVRTITFFNADGTSSTISFNI